MEHGRHPRTTPPPLSFVGREDPPHTRVLQLEAEAEPERRDATRPNPPTSPPPPPVNLCFVFVNESLPSSFPLARVRAFGQLVARLRGVCAPLPTHTCARAPWSQSPLPVPPSLRLCKRSAPSPAAGSHPVCLAVPGGGGGLHPSPQAFSRAAAASFGLFVSSERCRLRFFAASFFSALPRTGASRGREGGS